MTMLSDDLVAELRRQVEIGHAAQAFLEAAGLVADPAAAEYEERTRAARAWAKEQGLTVSERGRVPAHIFEQYDAFLMTQATAQVPMAPRFSSPGSTETASRASRRRRAVPSAA